MKLISRFTIILSVLALAHIYIAISFYLASGWNGVWFAVASVFLMELLMPILQFKGASWSKSTPQLRPLLRGLEILSLLAVGGFSIVFFFSAIRDFLLFTGGFFFSVENLAEFSIISVKLELYLTAGLMIIGVYQAVVGPGVKHVQIPLKGLPKEFEGFRIVQISDLHIGPTIRTAYVRNVVQMVNNLKGDMVALTGDITDGSPAELSTIAKDLSEIQATFGRFFVTGNHEYYHNAPAWIKLHREFNTRVLINENYIIEKQGVGIAILGVTDVSSHHFVMDHVSSPEKAAIGVPQDMIKILLAHQPASYKDAQLAGVHLQLSGHTHSGQFFPWSLIIRYFHDYYRGLNRFKDMWIYVNQGTGYWGPPLRAAVASEITLLTLTVG